MNVCIDGLDISEVTGSSRYYYTYELLQHLFEKFPQPFYHIMCDKRIDVSAWNKNKKLRYIDLNVNRKKNDYGLLEQYILENKIAVYHSPNNGFSLPFNKVCNTVITVHDMLPILNAAYADEKYLKKFLTVFPNAVEKADKIIAVSEFIKKQLLQYFEIPQEKIEVIYPGYSYIFEQKEEYGCRFFLKEKYKLEDEFIFFAGSIHAKNNLHQLLRLFKIIKNFKYAHDLKLVIAGNCTGKRAEYYSKIKMLAEHYNIQDSVIFVGQVKYDDMPYFYSAAQCVISLSEYDGFPQCAVEAMACGAPVVCKNTPFFQEILGKDILTINPEEEMYSKDALLEVIYNKKVREKAISYGLNQSEQYRWDKSIEKIIGVYENFF
jgi:glycosyltransferase involved in cell wall biosynthesis